MIEKTFVMVKPDAVERRLIGEIISRIEKKGYKIVAMKMIWMDKELAQKHYAEHVGKFFYKRLEKFVTTYPVVAMVVEGENAVMGIRKIVGKTDPQEAMQGTIRGDLGLITTFNLVHASDSPESARREIGNFFSEKEIYTYETRYEEWFKFPDYENVE
jgi:nucleoside-diphosphate kinase